MSRIFTSSFSQHQRSTSNLDLDNNPLLVPHASRSERSNSISMQALSPRIHSPQASTSPAASPSPPPSFYRHANKFIRYEDSRSADMSPSPSRTKVRSSRNGGRVQFAGPPPPITASVMLPRPTVNERNSHFVSRPSSSLDGTSGAGRHASSPATTVVLRPRRGSSSGIIDPLLGLERRERALQRDLQQLLDAQSAGLVQGFGGTGDESASEAGSSTPTFNSTRSRSAGRREGSHGAVVPVRQPKKKPISLRGARRGLLRDIGELAAIKAEEVAALTDGIAQRENILHQVSVWEQRISSFQKQLSTGSSDQGEDEAGRELAELRHEEKAVENEIREMEDRLAQMRARRKWLGERVREGENRREARLSSYRGALKEVEGEVRDFLKHPPVFPASRTGEIGEEEGFMQLPVGRRTLGMVRELWGREIAGIGERREVVGKEKEALEEGAKMWAGNMDKVVEFEDGLRKQMAGDMQDTAMLALQVQKMGSVIEGLQESARSAEEKGWNLLICALGAELEAFREGEGILREALGMVDRREDSDEFGGLNNVGEGSGCETKGNGLEELNVNGEQDQEKGLEKEESFKSFQEDSEDEGPNLAELLVDNSHGQERDGDGENSMS